VAQNKRYWSDSSEGLFPQRLPQPYRKSEIAEPTLLSTLETLKRSLHKTLDFDALTNDIIRRLHHDQERIQSSSKQVPNAAVIVPIIRDEAVTEVGDLRTLLTKRSANLSRHRNEISFPGGKVEREETVSEAAKRECKEEIGVIPQITLGEMQPSVTVRGTVFAAVVGVLDDLRGLRPSPSEVEKILIPSLKQLTDSGRYHCELWYFSKHNSRTMHFFELEGELVWGATAYVLANFLQLLSSVLIG
jgi:8-oxo-dGTP pyrophosphatase MutT (NUDIX family)